MRGTEFLDKMELVDPMYIEAADAMPLQQKHVRARWGAAAACLALLVLAGAAFLLSKISQTPSDLPMLSISKNTASMGYEGYMAYDASELVNANPWNENMALTTLPVYQNPLTYDGNHIASGADFEQMEAFLLEVAQRLGLDPNTLTITDDVPDEETKKQITEKLELGGGTVPDGYFAPTKLIVQANGIEIQVDQTLTATVSFDPAIALPEEYHFTHFASLDEITAVAKYLQTQYSAFIGIKNPRLNIHGGDYDIYARQKYSIEFSDPEGTDTQQIINYNFNRTAFYCNDDGKLFLARIYRPDLSVKVGDYPIISVEQARELLAEGSCLTTVPREMPGLECVKKVELVYRTGDYETYYMPYYRFYVELPEEKREHGLRDYGAYYVPAIDRAYISNMPTWDEGFH